MDEEYTVMPCKDSWRAINKSGYHTMTIEYRGYSAEHRYVYAKHHRVTLTSKDIIRHRCDHKWCVEITHLILGTHADNVADAMSRGQHKKPPRNTYLTKQHVNKIRRLYRSGKYTQADLAEEFDVSTNTVQDILYYKTWKEV